MEIYSFFGSYPTLYSPNDTDVLSLYGYHDSRNLIETDRFGYLNQFSNWKLGHKDDWFSLQSNISNSDEKFAEIFYKRIDEIVEKSNKENLNIYISWSGGVDSSAMVCGFLMSDVDKSKLKILFTNDSIEEHKVLYDDIAKNKIELIDISNDINAEIYKKTINDGLLVTGWCADQLFGSLLNQAYSNYYDKSWKDWIQYYSNNTNIDFAPSIEQCESAFEYYKLPVKKFPEWTWFMNFAVKWEFVKLVPHANIGVYSDRIINFFDVIDFQKWSINNYDKLTSLNQAIPNEYKLPLKKIIENYTKDTEYTKNKGKRGSWFFVHKKHHNVIISLLDDKGFKSYTPNFTVCENRKMTVYKRIIDTFINDYRK